MILPVHFYLTTYTLITQYLCLENGFEERKHIDYNRNEYADEELLFRFLENTQPKEVTKLKLAHGDNYKQRILFLIKKKINDETVVNSKCIGGIVSLLRTDIVDGNTGIKLKLFYDKPVSLLNVKDANQYQKNIFSVTRQVHYSIQNEKSLDLVVFINGLPIITFELKNELTKQNVKDAIKQYKTTRDYKEEIFRLARCLVHFAVDTEQVWMCTKLNGENSYFLPFNKGNDEGAGNPPNPSGIKTDYLWKEILTKENITNIIQNYVQLLEEETEKILPDGKIKKEKVKKMIFPRYHQLDSVKKLLADAKENGAGKRYLIQHSAGSGKSNSISWLAHQLIGLHDNSGLNNVFDAVVVVTDRTILDTQIRNNIKQFAQVEQLVEAITGSSADIKKLDSTSTSISKSEHLKLALECGKKIIISTIQTFPNVVEKLEELSGTKFAILIDEAHSSQTGNNAGKLNQTLGKNNENESEDEGDDDWTSEDEIIEIIKGRKMLTNASYFAFTATPKPKTLELFGVKHKVGEETKFTAFHLYSMKQAIEEGFILDVLLNYTTYQSHYALLKKIKDDPKYDKKKAQTKLKIFVESNEFSIAKKTAIMINHFMDSVIGNNKINGLAKAMVVTSSRKNAVKYKRAFDEYLTKNSIPFKSIVAFSGEIDGETELSLNSFSSALIPEEFKKTEYRFLIVANKYQTGFDQPLLHTMYVDKKLGGVSAVQTLSRLNRTKSGKNDTYVLDFANSTDEIKNSFEPYYKTTILGEATEPQKLFDLQNNLDNYQVYTKEQVIDFSDKMIAKVSVDQLHIILDLVANVFRNSLDEKSQDDFRAKCKTYVRLYVFLAQIVPFENPYLERLYIFLNHLQNKIQKEATDLAQGILDNIDMESIRFKKTGETNIKLQQGDELMPSQEVSSTVAEPELEPLSNIIKVFNEKFGTTFTNEDKVRKMTTELMQDVISDVDAMENINASLKNNDIQNAQITFTVVLGNKIQGHIDSDFEFYKEWTEKPEFKNFFVETMFNEMKKQLAKAS